MLARIISIVDCAMMTTFKSKLAIQVKLSYHAWMLNVIINLLRRMLESWQMINFMLNIRNSKIILKLRKTKIWNGVLKMVARNMLREIKMPSEDGKEKSNVSAGRRSVLSVGKISIKKCLVKLKKTKSYKNTLSRMTSKKAHVADGPLKSPMAATGWHVAGVKSIGVGFARKRILNTLIIMLGNVREKYGKELNRHL